MRLRSLALAFTLVVAAGSFARAQETPEPKKDDKADPGDKKKPLPFNPFEKAAEGDWTTLFAKLKVESVETENPIAEGLPEELLMTWRVKKIEEKAVTVAIVTRPSKGDDEKAIEFTKREAPSLETFLQIGEGEIVSDVKVTDEKKTVGGREFACKKVQFTTTSTFPAVKQETVLWLCPEVKGAGLVAVTMRTLEGGVKMSVSMEVAGFGSKDKADWGKKPEEIPVKERAKREPNEDDGEMAPPKKEK